MRFSPFWLKTRTPDNIVASVEGRRYWRVDGKSINLKGPFKIGGAVVGDSAGELVGGERVVGITNAAKGRRLLSIEHYLEQLGYFLLIEICCSN
jgi:hypothetical protein